MKNTELPAMTKRMLAEAAGCSYEWLRRVNNELPKERKLFKSHEGGGYDLAAFVQRWVDYNVDNAASAGEEDLDAVRARHEAVKMQKTELQVAQMRGELVDISDVKRLWATVAGNISRRLLTIPNRMASELAEEKNAGEVERALNAVIREELEELANTPAPEWAQKAEEDENAAEE